MRTRHKELTPANAWKAYWTDGLSFPECADLFGLSVGTLKRRFTDWNFPTRQRGPRKGSAGTKAKLTDIQVQRILDTIGELSITILSQECGVSRQRISQIRNGHHRPLE